MIFRCWHCSLQFAPFPIYHKLLLRVCAAACFAIEKFFYWISFFSVLFGSSSSMELLFSLPLAGFWKLFFINLSSISASLSEGGTPARFLIIDDGWQDTTNEFQKEGEPNVEGSQ